MLCKMCGEEVYPIGDYVNCDFCGSGYHCEVLVEYHEEISVSYLATQSQTVVYTQEEADQIEEERRRATADSERSQLEKGFRCALTCLVNVPEMIPLLPLNFEETAMKLFKEIVESAASSRLKTRFLQTPEPNSDGESDDDSAEEESSGTPKNKRALTVKAWDTIAILWLALRLEPGCSLLMSDLFRWARELHLFLPSGPKNRILRSNYRTFHIFTSKEVLGQQQVHPVDVKDIIRRISADLELPASVGRHIWAFYRRQYITRRASEQCRSTYYDVRIAASVLAVLKLHFGLNGQCEQMLDELAVKLNTRMAGNHHWALLFQFKEWLRYLMWRSAALKRVYYPMQIRSGAALVANELSPLFHHERVREEKVGEFTGRRESEKPSNAFYPRFDFSPSFYAYRRKDDELRQKFATLSEAHKTQIGLTSLKARPDFVTKSAQHALEPDKFLSEMKKKGIEIRKCPGRTGKAHFATSLRAEELEIQKHQKIRKKFYHKNPGKVLCDISNVAVEETSEDEYLLPVASQPLALFRISGKSIKSGPGGGLNEWTRDIRQQLPQSFAVLVEIVADMFELSEVELMREVYRLESAYNPDEIFGIAR